MRPKRRKRQSKSKRHEWIRVNVRFQLERCVRAAAAHCTHKHILIWYTFVSPSSSQLRSIRLYMYWCVCVYCSGCTILRRVSGFSAVCFGKRLLSSSFDVNAWVSMFTRTLLYFSMLWNDKRVARAFILSHHTHSTNIENDIETNKFLDRDRNTIHSSFSFFYIYFANEITNDI